MGMSVGKKGYQSDINITPYIDILLVLLIIFMTAVPMKKFDHQVRIPQRAASNQNLKTAQSVIIEMKLDRSILLNNEPITQEELEVANVSLEEATLAIGEVVIPAAEEVVVEA